MDKGIVLKFSNNNSHQLMNGTISIGRASNATISIRGAENSTFTAKTSRKHCVIFFNGSSLGITSTSDKGVTKIYRENGEKVTLVNRQASPLYIGDTIRIGLIKFIVLNNSGNGNQVCESNTAQTTTTTTTATTTAETTTTIMQYSSLLPYITKYSNRHSSTSNTTTNIDGGSNNNEAGSSSMFGSSSAIVLSQGKSSHRKKSSAASSAFEKASKNRKSSLSSTMGSVNSLSETPVTSAMPSQSNPIRKIKVKKGSDSKKIRLKRNAAKNLLDKNLSFLFDNFNINDNDNINSNNNNNNSNNNNNNTTTSIKNVNIENKQISEINNTGSLPIS